MVTSSSSSSESNNAIHFNVNKSKSINNIVDLNSNNINMIESSSNNVSHDIDRYHSEDDNIVTLRVKHNNTNSDTNLKATNHKNSPVLLRSYSFPNRSHNTNNNTNNNNNNGNNNKNTNNILNKKKSTNVGGGSNDDLINNIEKIRSFLESEFIPHEFWHLQRDSFIHRHYNEQNIATHHHLTTITNKNRHSTNDGYLPLDKDDCYNQQQHQNHQLQRTHTTDAIPQSTESGHHPNGNGSHQVAYKRDSFIRQSINNIRRSFSKNIKKKDFDRMGSVKKYKDNKEKAIYSDTEYSDSNNNNKDDEYINNNNSDTNIVYESIENHTDDGGGGGDSSTNKHHHKSRHKGHSRNSSNSSCFSNRSTSSLGLRSAPSSPMAPLQGQTETLEINSNHNINSLSRSPSHNNNSTKIESKTIKQVVTNSSVVASANTRSPSPHPTKSTKNDIPEKEKKKRKESSSGRQKKFHRHFQQVAIDEKVINYYSCALVSDILLQGHLYITDNYFAFYSNVFGFVTKLLIPIISVVKISKEKTVKIIPNAIGVATADERHVFGSFMSREAAYRLMLSVWAPEPETIKNIPKIPDVEISECSIEEDSSSAISGNESPPHVQESTTSDDVGRGHHQQQSSFITNTSAIDSAGVVLRNLNKSINNINIDGDVDDDDDDDDNNENIPYIHGESLNLSSPSLPPLLSVSPLLMASGKSSTTILQSSTVGSNNSSSNQTLSSSTSSSAAAAAAAAAAASAAFVLSSSQKSSSSSKMDKIVAATSRYFKFPTTFHIVYLGVFFVIILSMFSGYLLYRIIDIQAKTNQFSPLDFKWNENQDVDIYADVLKWQKEMQSKSVDEAQIILNSNLEQIAKVRKSLETLSILIHDKNAPNLPDTSSESCISVGSSNDGAASAAGGGGGGGGGGCGCGVGVGVGHSSLNVNMNNINENNQCDPGIS